MKHSSGVVPVSPHDRTCRAAPKQQHAVTGDTTKHPAPHAQKRNGQQKETAVGAGDGTTAGHVCYEHLCTGSVHADLWNLSNTTMEEAVSILTGFYPTDSIININQHNGYFKVTFRHAT